MMSSRVAASLICITAVAGLCTCSPQCNADDSAAPPINASGAGMTNDQLLETRPVISGIKSVDDAYQTVKEIQDRAGDIVGLCTNKVPVATIGDDSWEPVLTGSFTKTTGKYYTASKWKLRDTAKCIQRQSISLADLLSQNRNDHRRLRASDETCKKIEALRAEGRELLVPLTADIKQLITLITSNPSGSQDQITASAKTLIKSSKAVEGKLREIEKVLKREIKS